MDQSLAGSQSLTVFVLELVSAGYFGEEIGPSFRAEGRAMLDAVLEDFRRIPGVSIETVIDQAAEDVRGSLLDFVANSGADATLIIAPEFDRLLAEFCRAALRAGIRSLNCDQQSLRLCSDKFQFAQHLVSHGIPTIRSQLLDLESGPTEFPCVVKPRDGAGSWLVRLISRPEDWPHIAEEFRSANRSEVLCQPFILGKAYSVAAIVNPDHPPEIFPIATQRLTEDGQFCYRGGSIPADLPTAVQLSIQTLIRNCLDALPGLNGYVGCDVLVPEYRPEEPVLVEVNSRLTTSYIGYRRLCGDNLMERLLFPERFHRPLRWRDGGVSFDANGECRYAD